MTVKEKQPAKGGGFLIGETVAGDVFIPEDFTEEHEMIAQQCRDFIAREIAPKLEEIDSMKYPDLMPSLLEKAGELGLLGTSVPEEYGGFGMDFKTTMVVADMIGAANSFAVALSAHTGIGTLPILYYGDEGQKKKYVPKLATGEWKAAYCLTEPDSGSDANSGKTKAVLSEDGKHYIINGQKMWITNGGFADILVVFAKIDDDKNLSAFIVEKTFGGVTMNEEEQKMGIKGSSTRQIFFNDCKVPVENLLSERENGFKIAVNILNIGRIKLGMSAVGGAKTSMKLAAGYALERKQFGVPIGTFGAIQHKIAEMAVKTFAAESAHYRASQDIDQAYDSLVAGGMEPSKARLKSLEDFAIECAILKVNGSETLDFVVDESVQVFGGMGFSAESPMDRNYRDARINRIFEGTNEINRLLTVDMILKRAMKGQLDVMSQAKAVQQELMSVPDFVNGSEGGVLSSEKLVIANLKKACLMVAGAAAQKFMQRLVEEQEIVMNLADMLIEIYIAESALLRVEKLIGKLGEEATAIKNEMGVIYLHHAVEQVAAAGRSAITSFADGDELRLMLMGLKRFTKITPYNLKDARRRVAKHVFEQDQK